jgi:hypothetical protein
MAETLKMDETAIAAYEAALNRQYTPEDEQHPGFWRNNAESLARFIAQIMDPDPTPAYRRSYAVTVTDPDLTE